MSIIKERIQQLQDLGIPAKGIEALRKLWATGGLLLVDTCDDRYTIRPRLAKKMEGAGLIIIGNIRSRVPCARFDTLGNDIAFDLFGDE